MKLPEEDVERLEPSKVKHVTVLDRIASHLKCRKSGSQRTDCNLALDARQLGQLVLIVVAGISLPLLRPSRPRSRRRSRSS